MALLAVGLSNCSGPTTPSYQMTFTSSNVSSHTHTVTLSQVELKESEGDIGKTTSTSERHIHWLEITPLDRLVFGFGHVTVTTGDAEPPEVRDDVGSHWHTFKISKWW
jgi:hypothetical protein